MLIVNCIGGLGNQMSQYAYYLELKSRYPDVYFDVSNFKDYKLHNGYELNRVFGIEPQIIAADKVAKFKTGNIFQRVFSPRIIIQKDFEFKQKYLNFKGDYFIDGYWQSEKYFTNCVNQVIHDFTFPELDAKNNYIAEDIKKENSIAIHVRLGDYVNHPVYSGICTLDYYRCAIEIISSQVKTPVFYVFSNDIDWCKANLNLPNIIYVTGNHKANNYKDMHLMSLCKHNIIANSSFSWWGAWLNKNPDKIVISPKKWFNDSRLNIRDLLPSSWLKI